MGMHDDKDLNREENQKTDDDDNIFLTFGVSLEQRSTMLLFD